MNYYSAIQRNELRRHEKRWLNLKCLLLQEKSQSEKATYFDSKYWRSQLRMVWLTIFTLYNGAKAIRIQEKTYFEFGILIVPQANMTLGSSSKPAMWSWGSTTDKLTTICTRPTILLFTFSRVFSKLHEIARICYNTGFAFDALAQL